MTNYKHPELVHQYEGLLTLYRRAVEFVPKEHEDRVIACNTVIKAMYDLVYVEAEENKMPGLSASEAADFGCEVGRRMDGEFDDSENANSVNILKLVLRIRHLEKRIGEQEFDVKFSKARLDLLELRLKQV